MSQILTSKLPEHLQARLSAKRREWGVQLIAAALAVVCFASAGLLIEPINAIRQERQLVIDPDSIRGLPPGIALLGKLGTFRALAIDWASIRAARLKDEGKTYEALELHKTICKLAPRFPTVWVNAAWNMAYNISVLKYTPEQRWQWVRNGIELLRDEAILYNPKSVSLYKELAWIYFHKVGDITDDEHRNYKRVLAVDMERILGAPIVAIRDEEYLDWFREIVAAPRDLKAFLATDEEVAALVSRLRNVDLAPDESLLEFVARHLRPELQREALLKEDYERQRLFEQQMQLLTDPQATGARDRLLAAVRSDVLRRRGRFDLDLMMELMEQYGPLDWRNPYTHALYWSSLGDRLSRNYENTNRSDQLNTARLVFFALQNIIVRGRIALYPDFDDPFSSYLDLSGDTRFIPYLFETYLRLGKEHYGDDPDFREGTPGRVYMTGMVTNMENWIELLYMEGGQENLRQAENYYAWLRENNPHPDGSTQSRYTMTLDEFVMGDILNQLLTYRAAHGLVRSLVQRGLKHLSLGQLQAGTTALMRAKMCREYWLKDADVDRNERMLMPAMDFILRDNIEQFMTAQEISPLFKARLWKNLGVEQRQLTYDRLLPYFEKLCERQNPPWSVAAAFAEPPGLEEFRKTHLDLIDAPRREGVDEGTRFKD